MKSENKLNRNEVNDILKIFEPLLKEHCYLEIESAVGEPIKIGRRCCFGRETCFREFSEEQTRRALKELYEWIKKNGEPVYATYGGDVISKCLMVGDGDMWSHENDGIDYFYQFALDENGYVYQLMYDLDDIAERYKEENEDEEWDQSLDTMDYDHPTYIEKYRDDDWEYRVSDVLYFAVVDFGFCDDLIQEVFENHKKDIVETEKLCKCINDCFAIMGNPILE